MNGSITISILAKGQICVQTTACLMKTIEELSQKNIKIIVSFCMGSSDLPKSRSMQLSEWYKDSSEKDIFMFIDADQTFSTQDILLSMEYLKNYDVVCGSYLKGDGNIAAEPIDPLKFSREKKGELFYGATGFMMIKRAVPKKLIENFGLRIKISRNETAWPFFLQRIIDNPENKQEKLWLGEDYSFCHSARESGFSVYGYVSPTIGHILTFEKMVDIPVPKTWPTNSIVVFCGKTAEEWDGNSLKKGIGGSELAVIKLAKLWVLKGYSVTVYCSCSRPGIFDGVLYEKYSSVSLNDNFNILIIWRNIEILNKCIFSAKKLYLDLHDVVDEKCISSHLVNSVTKICVKSRFHASLLGNVDEKKVEIIPNGGALLVDNAEYIAKDRNYVIYSSSYDRGLYYMLKWGWPMIKKCCPNAYFNIFYGWDLYDLVNQTEESKIFKEEMVKLMQQDGVKECGRVSHDRLIQEKLKAAVHYYVGNFQETDCISVRESASLNCIPVVSDSVKVFHEKKYCLKIEGDPTTKECQEEAAGYIVSILKGFFIQSSDALPSVRTETWENSAKKWISLFENN